MTWAGWHFLPDNGRFRWNSKKLVTIGEWRSCRGKLELCKNGLHASKRLIDALRYATGALICNVELAGEIIEGGDKACARKRKVIAMADATKELHLFACWCAERAPRLANVTDKRAWDAAGDAAGDAAWDAQNKELTQRLNKLLRRSACRTDS